MITIDRSVNNRAGTGAAALWLATRLLSTCIPICVSTLAVAQSNLGELLDAGAKRLSAGEFKEEIVQRIITGPTPTGGRLEYMLAANGTISGSGVPRANAPETSNTGFISGEWRTDDADRVCLTMRMGTGPSTGLWLPSRCQFWYRLGSTYFFSDSDQDRSAPVLSRTVKR